MTPHRHSLRLSRIIRADAATLFRAWTDPEELLRVGGRYRLGMTDPDGRKHFAVGLYREIRPPVRLVFTWDWEEPAIRVGDTVVTVEFEDAVGDRTEVVLTHERFTDPARMGRHQEGWTDLLNLLQRHVGGIRP
ncbi:MAG TPA: SRPBCC domain-containing protein [Vicinamibacteria bacterium]|nr:SRPBCC domain-containing protein [Vicinamibacteria bacterium]